jgi:hypothetical protein
MTICANCQSDAVYTYTIVDGFDVYFCDKHLPRFARKSGLVANLPEVVIEEPVVAPKASKKVVVEEPVVEEVPVPEEETPVGE